MKVRMKETGFVDRYGDKKFILLESGQELTAISKKGNCYICSVPSVTKWPEHAWGDASIHEESVDVIK